MYADITPGLVACVYEAVDKRLLFPFNPLLRAKAMGVAQYSNTPIASSSELPTTLHPDTTRPTKAATTTLQFPPRAYERSSRSNLLGYRVGPLKIDPPSPDPPNRYVLFCVPIRRRLPHSQVNIAQCADEEELFCLLRQEYKSLCGFWRYRLSPRKFSHCDFVRVTRYYTNELAKRAKELPADLEYEYYWRPPEIPYDPRIPVNEWYNRFHGQLKTKGATSLLAMMPKRGREFVSADFNDGREDLWGLHVEYCFSFVGICTWFLVLLAGGLGFWGWWQGRHPGDLQDAAVPLTTTMALLVLFALPVGEGFKDLL